MLIEKCSPTIIFKMAQLLYHYILYLWWIKMATDSLILFLLRKRISVHLNGGRFCGCFEQLNMADVVLGRFRGPSLKGLAASTSCLLEQFLWVS